MKRYWPTLLVLGFVLVFPRLVGAMPPPGGLRWMLLSGRVPAQSRIIWHDSSYPAVVNGFYGTSWTPTTGFGGTFPTALTERNAGESISFSLVYYAEDGAPIVGDPQLRARIAIPLVGLTGASIGRPSQVETFVQGNPAIADTEMSGTAIERQFTTINRNNSGRPKVIVKLTWNNLPSPGAANSQVCVQTINPNDLQVGRLSGGTWSSLTSSFVGNGCFLLKIPANKVSVESGDVLATNVSKAAGGLGTLQFTAVNGQTFVNGQGWTRCNQFSSLPDACTPQTSVLSDSTTNARLASQFAAVTKAAQQVAIIGQTGLNETSFLTNTQKAWLNPRGQALYKNGSVTLNTAITAQGKKLIIAQGDININSIVGATGAQTAFISLGGNINISGTTFDGVAIAPNGRINLAGTGKLVMKGLLSAPIISFEGRTSADGTIATLTYDPRYQRGELLGLSAIMRPLVTEPAF